MRKIWSGRISSDRRCAGKISARKTSAVSFAVLALSLVAHAQLPSGGNAFFGYSYVHGQSFLGSGATQSAGSASMNGWEVSAEGKYFPWLGVVADLDWHYGGHDFKCVATPSCPAFRLNSARDTLLFGPRASTSFGKYRPFAEFLLGVGYQSDKGGGISNSDITFVTAFGGGLDYTLARSVAFRAQFDIVHSNFFGGSQNDPRISTGLAFRF